MYIGPAPKRIAPIDPEWVVCPSVPPRSRIVFSPIPAPLVRMEDPRIKLSVPSKEEGFSGYTFAFLFVCLVT